MVAWFQTFLWAILIAGVIGFARGKLRWILLAFIALGWALTLHTVGISVLIAALSICALCGAPLFVMYGVVTMVCFGLMAETTGLDLGLYPEKIINLTESKELLALPFFVFAGAIMSEGGIAKRLVRVAQELTDWVPGGLGVAAVAACVFFAAISGSSPVTVIAVGGMMFPAMLKEGFSERESIGLLTSAGSLGIVIPPSIPMIIYAIVVGPYQQVDIAEFFIAGIGPGLTIGGLLIGLVVIRSLVRARLSPEVSKRFIRGLGIGVIAPALFALLLHGIFEISWLAIYLLSTALIACYKAPKAIVDGAPALALPLLILGGIYSGLFSPTDSAAVAVVYAIVVAILVYRDMEWVQLPTVLSQSVLMIGTLIVIMVISFVLNDYFNAEQIPDRLVQWIDGLDLSRTQFLLLLNMMLLIVGAFMDIMSAILILTPLIAPMANTFEIDPLHLGLIFIVNLELGYLTPPLGLNLFVASSLFKKPLEEIVRSVIPYGAVLLIGVMMVTYIPAITLAPVHWSRPAAVESLPTEQTSSDPKPLTLEELMKQNLDPKTSAPKKAVPKTLDQIMKEQFESSTPNPGEIDRTEGSE